MRVKIAKWGNSAAIRLPKAVMDEMHLSEGTELDIRVEDGKVIVRPVSDPFRGTLEDMVAEMQALGGADYDYGQEEWPVLESELSPGKGFHDGS